MNVSDSMTSQLRTCRPEDTLAEAARILWEQDCGIVPVLGAEGELLGVVTDRDACMAAYTRGQRLDAIPVHTAMAKVVSTCRADWPLQRALAVMQRDQVRRLPVVDERNRCCGMLSISDVVRVCSDEPALRAGVVAALAAICRSRRDDRGTEKAVVLPVAPRAATVEAGGSAAIAPSAVARSRSKPKSRRK